MPDIQFWWRAPLAAVPDDISWPGSGDPAKTLSARAAQNSSTCGSEERDVLMVLCCGDETGGEGLPIVDTLQATT